MSPSHRSTDRLHSSTQSIIKILTFVLLFTARSVLSNNIVCDGGRDGDCFEATLNCGDANDCTVHCNSTDACYKSSISCFHTTSSCTIYCTGSNSCKYAAITCGPDCSIICENHGCYLSTIYIPSDYAPLISCTGNGACQSAEIRMETKASLNMDCDGYWSCYGIKVYGYPGLRRVLTSWCHDR